MKPLAEPCNEHQKKSLGEEMMASEAIPAGNTGEVSAPGANMRNTGINTK